MRLPRSSFLLSPAALIPALLIWVAPLLLAAATVPVLKQVAVLDIPGRPGFDEIALAQGMILVSHPGAGEVDLFNLKKRRVVGHVRNMSSPRGVAVDEATHLVYIANAGAHNIVVVSTTDWQVKRILPVGGAPESLLLTGNTLYVTFPDAQSIAAIDLTSNALASNAVGSNGLTNDQAANQPPNAAAADAAHEPSVSHVTIDGHPYALAYDPARRQLFLTVLDRRRVLVLNPALEVVASFSLNASSPAGIVFSPHHDRLYVAVRYAVLALDPATGQELSRSAVSAGIDQLILDEPTNSLLGVSNGAVFVLPAASTLGPATELPVDVKGHTLAYDSSTGYLYLPGGTEGRSKLLILKRLTANSN